MVRLTITILTCLWMTSCVIVEPEPPMAGRAVVVVHLEGVNFNYEGIDLDLQAIMSTEDQSKGWDILQEGNQILSLHEGGRYSFQMDEITLDSIYQLKLQLGTQNTLLDGSDRHQLLLDQMLEEDQIVDLDIPLEKGDTTSVTIFMDIRNSIIQIPGADLYYLKPDFSVR